MNNDDISKYEFLFRAYSSPVCKDFTSVDFSVVSKNYDFANSPPYATCSSDQRLMSVKSQRKSQTFPCPAQGAFLSCPFYRPEINVIKTSSFADKNVQLVKMISFDQEKSTFFDKYIVCSLEKELIYFDYNSDLDNETSESIFDKFVKEAANNDQFVIDKVQEKSQDDKPAKVSYLSKLISNFTSV